MPSRDTGERITVKRRTTAKAIQLFEEDGQMARSGPAIFGVVAVVLLLLAVGFNAMRNDETDCEPMAMGMVMLYDKMLSTSNSATSAIVTFNTTGDSNTLIADLELIGTDHNVFLPDTVDPQLQESIRAATAEYSKVYVTLADLVRQDPVGIKDLLSDVTIQTDMQPVELVIAREFTDFATMEGNLIKAMGEAGCYADISDHGVVWRHSLDG